LHELIKKLDLPEIEKNRLQNLSPKTYIGNAEEMASNIKKFLS